MVEREDLEKDKFGGSYPNKTVVRTTLADSNGNILKIIRKDESFNGTAGTGSNPTKTFALLESSDVEIKSVFHQGNRLDFTSMWTRDNSAKTITMVDMTIEDDEVVTIEFDI